MTQVAASPPQAAASHTPSATAAPRLTVSGCCLVWVPRPCELGTAGPCARQPLASRHGLRRRDDTRRGDEGRGRDAPPPPPTCVLVPPPTPPQTIHRTLPSRLG